MKKINGCLKKLLGKKFSKVGVQTRNNAPEVNASLTSLEIKQKHNMTIPPVATAVGHEGKYGTIYISSELMTDDHFWTIYPPDKTSAPGRSVIQNAYVHELGNEASYRASGGKTYGLFGKKNLPGAKEKIDEDSGYQLQLCVWGPDRKPKR
jgi:hypothetical protein